MLLFENEDFCLNVANEDFKFYISSEKFANCSIVVLYLEYILEPEEARRSASIFLTVFLTYHSKCTRNQENILQQFFLRI